MANVWKILQSHIKCLQIYVRTEPNYGSNDYYLLHQTEYSFVTDRETQIWRFNTFEYLNRLMGDDRWFSSYKDTYLAMILKLNHKVKKRLPLV